MTDDTTHSPIREAAVVEPFGDERDLTARLVALTGEDHIEVVHSSDRIETVEVGDTKLVFHMLDDRGGRFDVRAMNGAGRLRWRQSYEASANGIKKAVKEVRAEKLIGTTDTARTVINDVVYRLLSAGVSGKLEDENLFTPFVDESDPMSVKPYVIRDAASALIGPSGSTKSINAMACALARATGKTIGPHVPIGGAEPVLILDGEANRRDLQEIAVAIGRGHDIDTGELEANGLIRYVRIYGPIVGDAEALRLKLVEQESGLLIVDSLDTARGSDATNQTGSYYDVLRFLGVSSLSVDHVTGEMARQSITKYRALGSVRAVNRPRQTWAMSTPETPPEDEVPTTSRLNAVNRGRPGRMFKTDTVFEMSATERFASIRISDPRMVEVKEPTAAQWVLITIAAVARDSDREVGFNDVMEKLDRTRPQVDSAVRTLRDEGLVHAGTPLKVTPRGDDFLRETWGDAVPDPNEWRS